ncbi:dihydrodipicolinate synthase family protein [Arthrobacter glacialis]|uniref:Dihydrodipicolinate synthase family protein n=1 Tax=Arthrobacter glacialis TaxID=1664 RepID=A0A2S3ZRH3_ARTGL|nr:dihydrodipicolinate synthase family protein [Arthrobacter glacialis]POH71836.1 dihydrodipicolinate synthase family protein [Arthrobacter glacialis]
MFTGLSAFPLTPLANDEVDFPSFIRIIERLAASGTDSITALGSTGSYAYLTNAERAKVTHLSVEHAGGIPVFIGVSALRTSQVLTNVNEAQRAGAAALLLAPMTYQPLTADDVFGLYKAVSGNTDLPIIVYDNPNTTHFTFTRELYGRIAHLPGIASIRIPGVPTCPAQARKHLQAIRAMVPSHVTIGVSGDAFAAPGLNAGCEAWYSVVGGTLPRLALRMTRLAQEGHADEATAESERLAPLWSLFTEFGGSLRVIAAIAEHLSLVQNNSLPLPIQGLNPNQRTRVAEVVKALGLAA